jgi:putative DNA primase/helicase
LWRESKVEPWRTEWDGFEVVRKRPKGFVCRRPDGLDRWIWDLKGIERVLYRLPEVLAAVERGDWVFVVEGEKDADALADVGLVATTDPGGAGKWRACYREPLRGARVAIVPDNDAAGRSHAEKVAGALQGVAGAVRILELAGLPAKGDASDWIEQQRREGKANVGVASELLALAGRAPTCDQVVAVAGRPALRSTRMSEVRPEAVSFLWRPYLPLGKLTLLEGDPGQGKSWLTAAIAACGSVGRGLPAMEAFEPFRSVFFSAEDGKADTFRPRLDALGANAEMVYAHDLPLYLDTPEGLAELEREIEGRQVRLVVIDSVMSFVGARTDVYRANEVRAVLAPLAKLADTFRCVVVAVRHITKSKGGRAIYAGQGSIDFTATARSVLLAGSSAQDPGEHALLHIKSNVSVLGPAIGYRVDESGFSWTGESRLTAADLLAAESAGDERAADEEARRFLRELLADGPLAARKIFDEARKAGISEITLRRAKGHEGVSADKVGFQDGAQWLWRLPQLARKRT